jgi:hypothetical protein
MADGMKSTLFDFLDDIAARDVAEGRPRTWMDGQCPLCRQAAKHGPQATQQPEPLDSSPAVNVTWECLTCGVFQGPLAA